MHLLNSKAFLKSVFLGMFFTWNCAGCSFVAAVSQTNVPKSRNQPVSATVKKYIVLGFNFDNDEVLKLTSKLREKCPKGDVRGVLTKDVRTYYALIFFWARETTATGYCVPRQESVAFDEEPIEVESTGQSTEVSVLN